MAFLAGWNTPGALVSEPGPVLGSKRFEQFIHLVY